MKLSLLLVTARNAVIEIEDGGIYYTKEPYRVEFNGEYGITTDRVITSISDLKPNTAYTIGIVSSSGECETICITTKYEFVTLDVKAFGARGDGVQDDTLFLQAAIMACPKEGRVLVPRGSYLITSLFLKSDLTLELAEGSQLLANPNRGNYPILPGMIESQDERSEYNLGTWEGNPLPMFSGILTGINVENVLLYGKGTINGQAQNSDWWRDPKEMKGAFRPRLLFLNRCSNIIVQGIKFENSPAWNIHPYFSNDLTFLDLLIENPCDSPNTDGLDPESCRNVLIAGIHFTLGDDCIALKAGKIYMGRKYKVPCENITIRQCFMENGHGAVTIGSEMAAGVKSVQVSDCLFRSTDRGLRIKTRRGRGEDAVIDNISFKRIRMEEVMTPLVVNCFYCCDPDGKTMYVQSKEWQPVDNRTPSIKSLSFEDITCKACHVAAAYFYGLPEQKIERILLKNINFEYSAHAKTDVPAMMCDIEPCSKLGLFAANIKELVMDKVTIFGQEGERYLFHGIDHIIRSDC
jgi:polygalacturonase